MGGGCFCLHPRKPRRENPMHSSPELLVQRGSSAAAGYHHPPPMVTYSEGLGAAERLKAGFRTFKKNIYDQNPMLFGRLKCGQSPKFMVFACSDSRVCPSVTLDLKPGEAFTVRNIASLVPAYQQNVHSSIGSAIELAVTKLKVECIVVIGHSCCGGIRELLSLKEDRPRANHYIDDWVKIGLAIKKKVEKENASLSFNDQCSVLEIEAVNLSLGNLKTYPFVVDRLAKGTLELIGARYDFVCGSFQTWHA
uniref:Carbonic anhydrase n=1 Tax=Chandrasekharania keralensis TaxID=2358305 RepID=A0A3B8DUR5_9POAL|nr:beta-carbonic anhydrase 2P2 [Chandrasekharania keralensis]